MAMFDQQPMGPIPARRPILMPPDPQLEELLADPGMAEVTLVGPVPMELREPLPGKRRPTTWRRLRWVLAFLLVVPTIFNLISAATYLLGDDPDSALMRPARLVGAGIVLVILLVAHLLFLSSRRPPTRG
ncbi:MAG TPA: hypothetical protein VGK18_12620 [Propionicimonas sp.]|jgi:anti-sigma factor RsiW|uniref:hypothetical protein n=1 Tax=Propionicimonas sp. TaxID=1955623 RepID=UPI002F3FA36A